MMSQKLFLLIFYAVILTLANNSYVYSGQQNQANTKYTQPKNVLLIGIETLRADHVSCLGYHRNTTPTLDKLARKGVVFSGAMATSSWTLPAVTSVFTSLYPGVHKTTGTQRRLSENITTLTEILKENNYSTAAFVSNPTLDSPCGLSKGFQLYDDFSVRLDTSLNLFENNPLDNQGNYISMTSEPVNRPAISWLNKNHQKPFFMFVFYYDPHYDYVPPAPFDTAFDPDYKGRIDGCGIIREPRKSTRPAQRDLDHIIALYDGEILYTDGYIAELLEKFKELEILDDTLVVVFGDHGDEFYEHGSTGHGHSLYKELIHIPLIFSWPTTIPQNKQIDAIVSQIDVMPTVLDYLGIKYDGFMQGDSLRPLIESQKEKLHNTVYAEVSIHNNNHFAAAISKDNKFILDLNTDDKQLFDLNEDTNEQLNLYKERPANLIPLEADLTQWRAKNNKFANQFGGNEDSNKVEPDETRLRELKALGYLQ
ncbi:sulfatase [Planctomycetota bacterium]